MKGLGIGISLTFFSHVTAGFTIISYAVTIFEKAGTSFNPNVSSILLAVSLIFGSSATGLFDRFGRKLLNLISLMGSAVGLFSTSLYHYLYMHGFDLSAFAWVPVISLSFVIFISSAGIMPLTFICSVENFPKKVYYFSFFYYLNIFFVIYFHNIFPSLNCM